jgi:hypothetical protein
MCGPLGPAIHDACSIRSPAEIGLNVADNKSVNVAEVVNNLPAAHRLSLMGSDTLYRAPDVKRSYTSSSGSASTCV